MTITSFRKIVVSIVVSQLTYYCFEYVFNKNADLLEKNADNSKIKGILVLKGIYSGTTYAFVLKYQISSF